MIQTIDKIIQIAKWILLFIILAYTTSMFIIPIFTTGGNWQKIQNIWDRWQSLNVGMLALSSSLIALFITQYKEEKQRNRNFVAEKSFLPNALSDLSDYLAESGTIIKDRAEKSFRNRQAYLLTPGTEEVPGVKKLQLPKIEVPNYPEQSIVVFKECIRYAEPEVGDYISDILKKLQIHNSRTKGMNNELLQRYEYYESCLYSAAKIKALINNIFDYARNEGSFNPSINNWEAYKAAFVNLNIDLDKFSGLENFTKKRL